VLTVSTSVEALTLRAHTPDDAVTLHRLLQDNAEHLRASGDYDAEIVTGEAGWRAEFAAYADGREPAYSFGMWLDGARMIGRIVLVPVDPPRYGVGYWVVNSQQGKGFATASLSTILRYAGWLGATEVFAGVLHGNIASRRVLDACGFEIVTELDTHTRFRRLLREGA
jgi:RimJ/RimL family protein N-acetyltransferase